MIVPPVVADLAETWGRWVAAMGGPPPAKGAGWVKCDRHVEGEIRERGSPLDPPPCFVCGERMVPAAGR